MASAETRVVLYLNQFFGQVGGEDSASIEPRLVLEPIGPGRAFAGLLQPGEVLAGTIVCGDNYFADHPDEAAAKCVELVRQLAPDLFLAGPAFNAGRYGVACGAMCKLVSSEFHVPAITGMFEENPGVDLYRHDVYVVRTGVNAATMRETLGTMLGIARKLAAGETLGKPAREGYLAQGRVRGEIADKPGATRAVDMLLSKLKGAPFETEVALPTFNPAAPPPAVVDLSDKLVALVTDGGLVPLGNPDGIEVSAASKFATYSIAGLERLDPANYDVSHGGYDNRYVKADPNRLVPVDVARQLEREGRIGKLYERFVSTTGLSNPVANSKRIGRGIAEHLKQAGVEAVILTST